MKYEVKEILEYFRKYATIRENTMISEIEDYITNLQEEKERLKELCDKYEEEHNTAFKLWTMKMEEIPTYEEKKELQNRIDKAIKLINKYSNYPTYYLTGNIVKDLLNILQGEQNE